ncbi:MAG: DEAD/DEAH box helicase [Spirochaetaceae bacterium]|nr:DEAD/DEAH box helicase [Spirochaetaceae bacterium]
MKFTELQLHESLLKGIESAGYVECTPVQEQVLQAALDGADLYVQSQTGTGKTAAFLISIIQQMLARGEVAGKKALIMVPTRELAVQVEEEARTLISGTSLKTGSFYGGVGYNKQTAMLKENVDIIIGTPGRVIDLQESGTMDLSQVAFLVVDEADRMFDMGFYPDLRKLIKVLPKTAERQTMLFSATLNTYVKNLAWEYTEDPVEITIESKQITVEEIDQQLLHVSSDAKMKLLLGILQSEKPESVIIFCNTKRSCEVVAKRLQLNGLESEFIIGDLPQSKRLQVLDSFRSGSLKCLVATDVAARGIDVDDLAMVVNYDLPNESENYVHRIGRTARAGKSGKAYTFCSEQDVYNLVPIERYLGHSIPSAVAFDDMMAEDKSADVYIRTGDYGEDGEEGRRGHGDRRGGRGGKSSGNRGRNGAHRNGKFSSSEDGRNRKSGSHSKGDYQKEKKYTKDGDFSGKRDNYQKKKRYDTKSQSGSDKNYSRQDGSQLKGEDLSGLSFDQRMKVYKEKYGNNSQSGGNKGKSNGQKKGSKQNSSQQQAKHSVSSSQESKVATSVQTQEKIAPQKKGFLARLKGLFGGGTKSSQSDNK